MTNLHALEKLKKLYGGYQRDRICKELFYAIRLSEVNGGKHDSLIGNAIQALAGAAEADGAVTALSVAAAEGALSPMAADCKTLSVCAVGHAHIDMDWQWRHDETVNITLETFRTVLKLMDEYEFFTFSQSQASVYEIVEKYEPEMLEEIKRRVREGRWEVAAATWVEADKNMPAGESFARHSLYSRRYLSKLFGLGPEMFRVDFEPDTFGHSANIPEALNNAGVSYYYHCRGRKDGENIYRWRSPSGAELLVYRDVDFYLGEFESYYRMENPAFYLPDFCKRNNVDEMLWVYGVGNHGGGPTRRDMERMRDMMGWPIFPAIYCGGYHGYFDRLARDKSRFPIVDCEMNPVFSGCYSSQSKIKKYDTACQNMLGEAELFTVMAQRHIAGHHGENLEEYWRHVLFNQFHDILCGAGMDVTREYASGMYQLALSGANTAKAKAMRAISDNIDTAGLLPEGDDPDSTSEGGGAGIGVIDFQVANVERNSGTKRVYHLFNPYSAFDGATEITMWDWKGDYRYITASLADGTPIDIQVAGKENNYLRGHFWTRVLVGAPIPAYGWQTVIIDENIIGKESAELIPEHRVHEPFEYKMENDHLSVRICGRTGAISSITDKATGETVCRGAGLVYNTESSLAGMSSWITGRFIGAGAPMAADKIYWASGASDSTWVSNPPREKLRQTLRIEGNVGTRSRAVVTLSLSKNSRTLAVETETSWTEIGSAGAGVPNLSFVAPLGYKAGGYRYDVPFGTVDREAKQDDTPALSFCCPLPVSAKKAVALIAEGKHGFRGVDDTVSVTLLRSSFAPDPYPEIGEHKTRLFIAVADDVSPASLLDRARRELTAPSVVSGWRHPGKLAASAGTMSLEGAQLCAVKPSEDGYGTVIRVFEPNGKAARCSVTFDKSVKSASLCDFHENVTGGVDSEGCKVSFDLAANKVASLIIAFADEE